MPYSINDWNLNPNQQWYVVVKDIGSVMDVALYSTLADAQAETNIFAEADSVPFGSSQSVVFEPVQSGSISFFNDELTYHLKVSGSDGDPEKIFSIAPFIDLPDINNSIYRSESLIQTRAISEINIHTHIKVIREIGVATHIPSIKVGDVCRVNSTRLGIDVLTNVEEVVIMGNADSLTNHLGTVEYTDLSYG